MPHGGLGRYRAANVDFTKVKPPGTVARPLRREHDARHEDVVLVEYAFVGETDFILLKKCAAQENKARTSSIFAVFAKLGKQLTSRRGTRIVMLPDIRLGANNRRQHLRVFVHVCLGIKEKRIQPLAFGLIDQSLQTFGDGQLVVRIHEVDVFASRRTDPTVPCRALPMVLLRQHTNARVFRRISGKNHRTRVSRAVVNADNFNILQRLIKDGVQTLPEPWLGVVDRDYNRQLLYLRPRTSIRLSV